MLNTIDVLGEMSRKKVMIRPCRPERLPCATSLQPIERGAFPLRALKKGGRMADSMRLFLDK